MPLRSLRDTRLQRTLNRITSQIIGAIVQTHSQQRFRLPDSDSGEHLQIFPLHATMLPNIGPNLRTLWQVFRDAALITIVVYFFFLGAVFFFGGAFFAGLARTGVLRAFFAGGAFFLAAGAGAAADEAEWAACGAGAPTAFSPSQNFSSASLSPLR